MIIDLILDRHAVDAEMFAIDKNFKENPYFSSEYFAKAIAEYEECCIDKSISEAIATGKESAVKAALCEYVIYSYNPHICAYIWAVNWLENSRVKNEYDRFVPIPEV